MLHGKDIFYNYTKTRIFKYNIFNCQKTYYYTKSYTVYNNIRD